MMIFHRFMMLIALWLIVFLGFISTYTAYADIGFEVTNNKIKKLLVTAEKHRLNDIDKGFIPAQEALDFGNEYDNIKIKVYASLMLARLYEKKYNHEAARDYYTFSVDALNKNPKLLDDANILFFITEAARYQKEYTQAFDYIKKGIAIKEQEGDAIYLSRAFDLYGNLYKGKKNYKESINSYFLSLKYAEKTGLDDYIVNAYLSISDSSRKINDHETSLKFNQKALEIIEQKGDLSEIARCLEYISTDQRSLGFYAPALQTAKRALGVQRELENISRISNLLLSMSISYLKLSSYDNALEYALEMLSLHEEEKYPNGIASASNQIGHVYSRLKQYDDALYYYNRTLSKNSDLVDTKYQAAAYRGMATVEYKIGNYKQGLVFAEKANTMYRKLKNTTGIASSIRAIADIYRAMGENDKALEYFYEGLDLSKIMNDLWVESSFSLHVGELLIETDMARAREYIDKARSIAIEIKANSIELDVFRALVKLETKNKNYKKALEYSEDVYSLMNSLGADEVNDRVAELKIIQEIEKKEREIDELKRTTKINELELGRQSAELEILNKERTISSLRLKSEYFSRVFLISIILFIGVALLLLYLRYRLIQKTQKILSAQSSDILYKNKKLEKSNDTKDRFFSIISHDLRDPISSLLSLAKILQEELPSRDSVQLKKYVDAIHDTSWQTYKLLNDLLTWGTMQLRDTESSPVTCAVFDVSNAAINHLKLSAKTKNIQINNYIDKSTLCYVDKNMMTTAIRNLLANAIKFTPENGNVNIFSKIHGDSVTVHIQDFGVGISKADQENIFRIDKLVSRKGTNGEVGTGLGLTLCKDLIEKNGSELKLISEVGQGSDFFFTLPSNQP